MRRSGILMHISSLPGGEGIGTLGQEAFAFADFLADAGMSVWQMLPVCPVGYGESPYQSPSAFAGNPLLISLETLRREGLLDCAAEELPGGEKADRVDYDAVRSAKEKLLRKAFEQSGARLGDEIDTFAAEHAWAEDYALFAALKQRFGGQSWTSWPDRALRMRSKAALAEAKEQLKDEIRFQLFVQTLFFRQWKALRTYANGKGLQLLGDMPIYVAEDSADTWTHPEIFQLDRNRKPKRVAGVPPDFFSEDGQMWGNPLYRWHRLRFMGYGWWVERMRAMAALFDIVRIDHFIGFGHYYSIPAGRPNARVGKWVNGPGRPLFRTLNRRLPGLQIVAEDLGEVNDRVRDLMAYTGYPGMRVAVYGLDGEDNMHRPANYPENCVGYTGTHDNATVLGWALGLDEAHREKMFAWLHIRTVQEAPEALIRMVMASKAGTAVIAMQDALGLDNDARMNLPGTVGGNWRWRMLPGAADADLAARLRKWNEETKRGGSR